MPDLARPEVCSVKPCSPQIGKPHRETTLPRRRGQFCAPGPSRRLGRGAEPAAKATDAGASSADGRADNGSRSMDEERAQVAVAALDDASDPVLVTARRHAWREPEAGREVACRLELACITYCGDQGRGRQRFDPGNPCETSPGLAGLVPSKDLSLDCIGSSPQVVASAKQHLNRRSCGGRHVVRRGCREASAQFVQASRPLCGNEPELAEELAQGVDGGSPLATRSERTRYIASTACFAIVFIGTKRMFGRLAASQIASASAASVLFLFTGAIQSGAE